MAEESPRRPTSGWWQAFDEVCSVRNYARGARLFAHGCPASGIFVIESGHVRVLAPVGTELRILETVGPGAVLGLSETVTNGVHRVTAEADDCVRASFVERNEFQRKLREHTQFCMQVVALLSEDLHSLYSKVVVLREDASRSGRASRHEFIN